MSTAVMGTSMLNRSALNRSALNRSAINRSALNGVVLGNAPVPRLRLTKRGRRVLVFLVAFPLVAAALAFALNGGIAAATNVSGASSLQYVTVESGQSLWQLAAEIAPTADPRDVISDVVHLNQLTGTDIQAGQRLAIPTRYSH